MPNTNILKEINFKGQNFYIGLDVHKKSWSVTIRSLGIRVAHFTQTPVPEALVSYLHKNFPGGIYFSAYEAGFSGTHAHEKLCLLGVRNIIFHAADLPSTDKQKKNKNDLHDSRYIAEHLEGQKLKSIHILSSEQQQLRALFRYREGKVGDVTRANNRLKSFLMLFGITMPENLNGDRLSIKALKWLANLNLQTEAGSLTLRQYVNEVMYQRKQVFELTKQLRYHIKSSNLGTYQSLLSIPGIGAITAMGLIAEIVDFNRFKKSDDFCSYLGLCPWEDSSGDKIRTKGMQPRCNKHLRPLIIEASWIAIRKSPQLFSYYSKHAQKGPSKAIVKVARKIALMAKALVLKNGIYDAKYYMHGETINSSKKEKLI
jgi:transposase